MLNPFRLLLIMATLIAGCASSPEKEGDFAPDAVVRALIARGDADSLAAAAVLREFKDPKLALNLLARASAAEPSRPDLLWMRIQVCAHIKGCDPAPLEIQLRWLAPENGIGWAGMIARALDNKDEAETDRLLNELGNKATFDVYWTGLQARLLPAIQAVNEMPLQNAITHVVGGLAGAALPSYSGIVNACKEEHLHRESRRRACQAAATPLLRGDTYITALMGTAMAKRAWPAESPEAKAILEGRRMYWYRWEVIDQIDGELEWNEAAAGNYLQLIAQHTTEQGFMLARILAAKRDPNPPEDWKPKGEREE